MGVSAGGLDRLDRFGLPWSPAFDQFPQRPRLMRCDVCGGWMADAVFHAMWDCTGCPHPGEEEGL